MNSNILLNAAFALAMTKGLPSVTAGNLSRITGASLAVLTEDAVEALVVDVLCAVELAITGTSRDLWLSDNPKVHNTLDIIIGDGHLTRAFCRKHGGYPLLRRIRRR